MSDGAVLALYECRAPSVFGKYCLACTAYVWLRVSDSLLLLLLPSMPCHMQQPSTKALKYMCYTLTARSQNTLARTGTRQIQPQAEYFSGVLLGLSAQGPLPMRSTCKLTRRSVGIRVGLYEEGLLIG